MNQAIVIGASIAGLLSAKILSTYFDNVIIIDKDIIPEDPKSRLGVPQSLQPHILFAKGYQIIENLFPGIGFKLSLNGALRIDWAKEFYFFGENGWAANSSVSSDVISFSCSRPLLEWTIRQFVSKIEHIHFLTNHRVVGLLKDSHKEQIIGVQIFSNSEKTTTEIRGSLVIDTSGRNSKSHHWLQRLGFNSPTEIIVNPKLGYATRRYEISPDIESNWKVMLISQSPPDQKRLGYLAKIENNQLIATLGGYGGDYPGITDSEFNIFAKQLAAHDFLDHIHQASPISSIHAHRATLNRWRRFDWIDLPSGFITLGDAVCALCPVYGQGMTVSALGAITLDKWLKESLSGFGKKVLIPQRFQKKLARDIFLPWTLATTQDLRFPSTEGEVNPSVFANIMEKYSQKILLKATRSEKINTLCLQVAHQLKSPLSFYEPQIIFQVLFE